MKNINKAIRELVRYKLENYKESDNIASYGENIPVSGIEVKKVRNENKYNIIISLDTAEENIIHVKSVLDEVERELGVSFGNMYISL